MLWKQCFDEQIAKPFETQLKGAAALEIDVAGKQQMYTDVNDTIQFWVQELKSRFSKLLGHVKQENRKHVQKWVDDIVRFMNIVYKEMSMPANKPSTRFAMSKETFGNFKQLFYFIQYVTFEEPLPQASQFQTKHPNQRMDRGICDANGFLAARQGGYGKAMGWECVRNVGSLFVLRLAQVFPWRRCMFVFAGVAIFFFKYSLL